MLGSARIIVSKATKPFMESFRQKGDMKEWCEAHRKFDKILYEIMPSSTFVEVEGYPIEDEDKTQDITQTLEGPEGVIVNHNTDRMSLITKEFSSPYFSGRMITPNPLMEEMHNIGAINFEQDEHTLKYTINIAGFDPEDIQIRLIGDRLTIDAKEEHNDVSENAFTTETKEFTKSFLLPWGTRKGEIKTVLNEEGRLCITIPKPEVHELKIEKEALKIEHEDKKKAEA